MHQKTNKRCWNFTFLTDLPESRFSDMTRPDVTGSVLMRITSVYILNAQLLLLHMREARKLSCRRNPGLAMSRHKIKRHVTPKSIERWHWISSKVIWTNESNTCSAASCRLIATLMSRWHDRGRRRRCCCCCSPINSRFDAALHEWMQCMRNAILMSAWH